MARHFTALSSDFRTTAKAVVSAAVLLSGTVACVAIATFVSYVILLRPQEGIDTFFAVLAFSNAGFTEPVRQVIEVMNWIGLLAIVEIVGAACFNYFCTTKQPSKPVRNVVQFPRKLLTYEQAVEKTANG